MLLFEVDVDVAAAVVDDSDDADDDTLYPAI